MNILVIKSLFFYSHICFVFFVLYKLVVVNVIRNWTNLISLWAELLNWIDPYIIYLTKNYISNLSFFNDKIRISLFSYFFVFFLFWHCTGKKNDENNNSRSSLNKNEEASTKSNNRNNERDNSHFNVNRDACNNKSNQKTQNQKLKEHNSYNKKSTSNNVNPNGHNKVIFLFLWHTKEGIF